MIGVVDYGLGNVQAILNIYKRANIPAALVRTPEALAAADRFILPGVGSFDWGMQCLDRSGLRETLDTLVTKERRPVLGICVGMQMMAHASEEGAERGLGWIDASVKCFAFASGDDRHPLPHMGWNDVAPRAGSGLFGGLEADARFYFLHSYFVSPQSAEAITATCDYGGRFACGVQSGNCYGVQFHPEKSHGWGVRLLTNFADVRPC